MKKINIVLSTLFLLTSAPSFADEFACKILGTDGTVVASLKTEVDFDTFSFDYMEKYAVGEEQRTYTLSSKDQSYSCENLEESDYGFACYKKTVTPENKTQATFIRIIKEPTSPEASTHFEISIEKYNIAPNGAWIKADGKNPMGRADFYDCVPKL